MLSERTQTLMQQYSTVMRELRDVGIVRSSNNPVADIGEHVACEVMGLKRAPKNARGYDAIGEDGKRYEVKSRRHTLENPTSQMGMIRDLDKNQFDSLIVVLFAEDFSLKEIWKVPHSVVEKFAKYKKYSNAHILIFSGAILKDALVQRVYPVTDKANK